MNAIASKDLQDIDFLVGKVSASTGLSSKVISNQLEESDIKAFRFDDRILIAPEDFDSIIDGWAENIKVKLSIKSSSDGVAPIAEATVDDKVIDEPTVSLEKLEWPDGFEELVTHLYSHTLKKILPEDAAQKRYCLPCSSWPGLAPHPDQ